MERGGFPKRPPKRRAVSWWQHDPADRSENVFSRPQIRVDQSNLAVPFWNICGPCPHKATPLPKCELGGEGVQRYVR
jgi:hypothetical protein